MAQVLWARALKESQSTDPNQWPGLTLSSSITSLLMEGTLLPLCWLSVSLKWVYIGMVISSFCWLTCSQLSAAEWVTRHCCPVNSFSAVRWRQRQTVSCLIRLSLWLATFPSGSRRLARYGQLSGCWSLAKLIHSRAHKWNKCSLIIVRQYYYISVFV